MMCSVLDIFYNDIIYHVYGVNFKQTISLIINLLINSSRNTFKITDIFFNKFTYSLLNLKIDIINDVTNKQDLLIMTVTFEINHHSSSTGPYYAM